MPAGVRAGPVSQRLSLTELSSILGPAGFVYVFKAVQTAIVAVISATLFIRTHIHNKTFADANLIAG